MDNVLISIGILLLAYFISYLLYVKKNNLIDSLEALAIILVVLICLNTIIILIDYESQTNCEEVWSGMVISVEHKEEYDEYHTEETRTYTTTDSDGNTITHTETTPAYWEHHNATNYIDTTDKGKIYVNKTPDGKLLTDDFVNSNKELEQYYPIGYSTASIHTYENKVQASYSIYRHKEIDLSEYKNKLPKYPKIENDDYTVDRFVGKVPNKKEVLKKLNKVNSNLNWTENPNNKKGTKSYKQVNIIFVNLGNVSKDYGYALQDYWQGGNKNDYVICFGTKGNKITWSYSFSWSEVESLKTDTNNYMLDKADLNNFTITIDDIGKMIENKFVRKQFADFSYLTIEVSTTAKVFVYIITFINCLIMFRYNKYYL